MGSGEAQCARVGNASESHCWMYTVYLRVCLLFVCLCVVGDVSEHVQDDVQGCRRWVQTTATGHGWDAPEHGSDTPSVIVSCRQMRKYNL